MRFPAVRTIARGVLALTLDETNAGGAAGADYRDRTRGLNPADPGLTGAPDRGGVPRFHIECDIPLPPVLGGRPQLVKNDLNDFMKNLAIMGAILYIAAYESGPLSLGKDSCDNG